MNTALIQRTLAALSAWLLLGLAQAAEVPRDPDKFFFQETFGDYREELALAREEGKQGVLLFFQQADCPFCFRMKTTILNQPGVQEYYRSHFRMFSIDVEGDLEITGFDGKPISEKDFAFFTHQVKATPVFAFFDLDGALIARHTGPTYDAAEFLLLGEFVAEGHYRTGNFTRFKRARRAQAGG